ncbi:hypothetical protein CYY_001193 [Polysphondylium violaceum]|uniref:Uncharacterized protein n=1 Tax=Polysphondylium violaceum TaxID=133409 RepID=A0A8J4Q297_9MYCE|nr:hypothetical protein CYY_001193 [Polysphondylium violaceum]
MASPNIKYPLVFVKTKYEWEKIVKIIGKHQIPLRLSFSLGGLKSYIKSLSEPSLSQKFKQMITHRHQMTPDQVIATAGPHFDTLSFNDYCESKGYAPLLMYFKNLEQSIDKQQQYKFRKYKATLSVKSVKMPTSVQLRDNPTLGIITHLCINEWDRFGLVNNDLKVFLSKMVNVQSLSIDYENTHSQHVNQLLETLLKNNNLCKLSLRVSSLTKLIDTSAVLKTLKLYSKVSVSEFETIVNKNTALENLYITVQDITTTPLLDFVSAAIYNTSLQTLALFEVSDFYRFHYLQSMDLPNLRHLTADSFISPADIEKNEKDKSFTLGRHHMPKLESLCFGVTKYSLIQYLEQFITSTVVTNLLPQSISHLSFNSYRFTMNHLTLLLQLLAKDGKIRKFEFSDGKSAEPASPQQFESMLEALIQNTQLTSLNLSNNGLSNTDNTLLLFKALECLDGLASLNLGKYVSFGNTDEIKRYKSLIKQKSLRNLLCLNFSIPTENSFNDKDNRLFLNSLNILVK